MPSDNLATRVEIIRRLTTLPPTGLVLASVAVLHRSPEPA